MENYASMDRKFLELGMRLQHAREPEVTFSAGNLESGVYLGMSSL